jgi:acetyl-CoA carboxylase biotin carboxyl carrier protein
MDNGLIKSLIDALEASTLSELEYSKDGVTVRLVKGSGLGRDTVPEVAPSRPVPAAPRPESPAPSSPLVVAPLSGVVHLRRTPGAPPLVTVGQAMLAGQVLCLIEAMKVFTELRAERDGTIASILVEPGQDVEAGQAIFRWE